VGGERKKERRGGGGGERGGGREREGGGWREGGGGGEASRVRRDFSRSDSRWTGRRKNRVSLLLLGRCNNIENARVACFDSEIAVASPAMLKAHLLLAH
jgi:hypothetical protein